MMITPMDPTESSNSSARSRSFALALLASLAWCAVVGTPELRSSRLFAPVVTTLVSYTGNRGSGRTISIPDKERVIYRSADRDRSVSRIQYWREIVRPVGESYGRAVAVVPLASDESGTKRALLDVEQHVQRRPSYVKKTVFSDKVRFVFIASQDGTGHHGWRQALGRNRVCERPTTNTFRDMSSIFFKSWTNKFGDNADRLRQSLRENVATVEQERKHQDAGAEHDAQAEPVVICLNTLNAPMMSYPNGRGSNLDHHPDINLLAQIAEEAGVDLRIITLHRPPANVVVSCSVHRSFGTPYRESLLQVDQTAVLVSQLESLDPAFYACAATSEVVETAAHLQEHVFGGMSPSFTPRMTYALNATFVDRTDNQTKARMEIQETLRDMGDDAGAGSINRVLDELLTSYMHFRNVVCANKRR